MPAHFVVLHASSSSAMKGFGRLSAHLSSDISPATQRRGSMSTAI
jgi:hypothetical protein